MEIISLTGNGNENKNNMTEDMSAVTHGVNIHFGNAGGGSQVTEQMS